MENLVLYKSVMLSNVSSSDHCFLICNIWVSMGLSGLNKVYLKCFLSRGLVILVTKNICSFGNYSCHLCASLNTDWRWLWRNIFGNKSLISSLFFIGKYGLQLLKIFFWQGKNGAYTMVYRYNNIWNIPKKNACLGLILRKKQLWHTDSTKNHLTDLHNWFWGNLFR